MNESRMRLSLDTKISWNNLNFRLQRAKEEQPSRVSWEKSLGNQSRSQQQGWEAEKRRRKQNGEAEEFELAAAKDENEIRSGEERGAESRDQGRIERVLGQGAESLQRDRGGEKGEERETKKGENASVSFLGLAFFQWSWKRREPRSYFLKNIAALRLL